MRARRRVAAVIAAILQVIILAPVAMAADRTTITATTAPGRYPTTLTAVTMTAADVTNGNRLLLSGDENDILIMHNTHASTTVPVTITSVADPVTGRTGNVGVTLAADDYRVFGPAAIDGWSSGGYLLVDSQTTDVKFGHLKLK